jgi:hypothetical protein
VPLLELKLLDTLFELLMESYQERYLFNEIAQVSRCLLVRHIHVLSEILQGDHHFVQGMRLKQVSER